MGNKLLDAILNRRAPQSNQGIGPTPDAPSPIESIGRGYMDMIDPLTAAYHFISDRDSGASYRQQQKVDEQLYRQGLYSTDPSGYDPLRVIGRTAGVAPFAGGGAGALAALEANQGWEAVQTTARNLYESPWGQNALARLINFRAE